MPPIERTRSVELDIPTRGELLQAVATLHLYEQKLALGGGHPDMVVVPRKDLRLIIEHAAERLWPGDSEDGPK